MDKAKEKLRYESLSDEEKKMYDRFQENRRIEMSVEYTVKLEAKQERNIEIAKSLFQTVLSNTKMNGKVSISLVELCADTLLAVADPNSGLKREKSMSEPLTGYAPRGLRPLLGYRNPC